MAAAAKERVEEEEGDCNCVGGEIAVFVEKLCGAIATDMQEKELKLLSRKKFLRGLVGWGWGGGR